MNQVPLSLNEMKRSPLASSRSPDSPPKPGKDEVNASPLRYCSDPKRTCELSRGSNEAIGRALTSIDTGTVAGASSEHGGFGGGSVASCAWTMAGSVASDSPAAADCRKRRRRGHVTAFTNAAGAGAGRGGRRAVGFAEQFGKLFGDGTAQLFGIDDGDGAAIITGDVVTDADRNQLDRRPGLDLLDDVAQMTLQIVAGVDRQGGNRQPAHRRKSSSGSCAVRSARAAACAPSPAPRRRCFP